MATLRETPAGGKRPTRTPVLWWFLSLATLAVLVYALMDPDPLGRMAESIGELVVLGMIAAQTLARPSGPPR